MIINNIDVYGEPLLKENIEFFKENGNKAFIKIFATQLSLKLLSSKTITQYYQDETYKITSKMDEIKVLIVLIGKDIISNKFELILVATFSEESAECYKRFYNLLKTTYNFVPSIITNDFGLANLKALDEVYDKDDIIITVKAGVIYEPVSFTNLRYISFTKSNFFFLNFLLYSQKKNLKLFMPFTNGKKKKCRK